MSSNPIEGAAPAYPAAALRRRGGLKWLLPQTLFGRSLLIIVMPLILLQAIVAWVFYERHWSAMSWRLSAGVAGDVGLLIEAMRLSPSAQETQRLLRRTAALTDLDLSFRPGAVLPEAVPPGGSLLEDQLRQLLHERVARPFRLDIDRDPLEVGIAVQLPQGVLAVAVPRKRLSSPTTYIFVLWMIGSSLVLLSVAAMFMRNQVRAVRRLAAAADSFGKGRPVPHFKAEGAVEVRQAALAFMTMRDRIERQIRQRTEMLAGVSHDLRTPLTRMKLALELLGPDPAAAELRADVADMEHMVNGYLDFVRGEGAETPVETDIALLLEEIAAGVRRDGTPLSLAAGAEYILPVRANALRRCLDNLIGNARRHGSHVWLTGVAQVDGIDILVDDDGPGIAADDRERAFQPFIRLDKSRNPSTGGVGLGLTIARDVARSHGGDIRLETSPQGGLRARLHLPR